MANVKKFLPQNFFDVIRFLTAVKFLKNILILIFVFIEFPNIVVQASDHRLFAWLCGSKYMVHKR